MNKIKQTIQSLPTEVRIFLQRVILLFIGWKLLYIIILIPNESIDPVLVRQLGNGTAFVLNKIYNTNDFHAVHTRRIKRYGNDDIWATYSFVYQGNKRAVLGIYQACNGLELMILYAGFIICFTGIWQRKILYIIPGVVILFLINILRSALLGYIAIEYPRHFEFAHKYFFNLVVYSFIFLLWMGYVSKVKINKAD